MLFEGLPELAIEAELELARPGGIRECEYCKPI